MPAAAAQLAQLLELAEKGPALRAALAEEVADLLLDWPKDCPADMRRPCEALLERAAGELGPAARARVVQRIGAHPELPVPFLNTLFFHASDGLRKNILSRNETADLPCYENCADEAALISAARTTAAFSDAFARLLDVTPETAETILADRSGQSLAIACKGAHVSRAGFSALTLLIAKESASDWLNGYENIPQLAAGRLLKAWSIQSGTAGACAQTA